MATTRADEVAEILWELKRAQKVATLASIARRAGFSPGSNGRAIATTLRAVRRDWPHLQWWRAVQEGGVLPETEKENDGEQALKLTEAGFELVEADGRKTIKAFETHLMRWEESTDSGPATSDE